MANEASSLNNGSSSATGAQRQLLSSIGENVTNVRSSHTRGRFPNKRPIFKIDELNPSLTKADWVIQALVIKKRGPVPFGENGQYTEVYLQDVKTVSLLCIGTIVNRQSCHECFSPHLAIRSYDMNVIIAIAHVTKSEHWCTNQIINIISMVASLG